MPEVIGDNVDRLTLVEMRMQGIDRGKVERLYRAARGVQGGPLTMRAATLLRDRVKQGDYVVIVTGASSPPYLPSGETDGPPGAVAIAAALGRGLGARPVLVAEPECLPALQAAAAAAGLPVMNDNLAAQRTGAAVCQTLPIDDEESRHKAQAILEQYRPRVVIAIEKLGPNAKGVFHSLRGVDVTRYTGKAHHLIEKAQQEQILTLGFGDGGNELGCGLIYETTRQIMDYGATCQCPCGDGMATITSTDVLVISSISNWGAYGTVACLAWLLGDPSLIPDPADERRVIEQCALRGASDGMTGLPIPWVDGTPIEVQMAILTMLHTIVVNGLKRLNRPF